MKILPIAGCRLPILKLFAGRGFAGGCHDGCQGVGFFKQGGQFICTHDAGFAQQFQPERSFIGLFFDRSDFGDEFRPTAGAATGAATGAVIGRDRCAAADDLFGYGATGIIGFGDGACEFDNSQGECFGASLKFSGVHLPKLQIQPAIGNRQPAIQE